MGGPLELLIDQNPNAYKTLPNNIKDFLSDYVSTFLLLGVPALEIAKTIRMYKTDKTSGLILADTTAANTKSHMVEVNCLTGSDIFFHDEVPPSQIQHPGFFGSIKSFKGIDAQLKFCKETVERLITNYDITAFVDTGDSQILLVHNFHPRTYPMITASPRGWVEFPL